MNKILIIDTAYPINSRNVRILQSLIEVYGEDNVKFAAWNRDNREISIKDKDMFVYTKQAKYGNPSQKFFFLFSYFFFLRKVFRAFSPQIVIASHWDSLFLCHILIDKKQNLIYENLDIPTASNKFILSFLLQLEKISLKKVRLISLASRFYQPLYEKYRINTLVLENKIVTDLINIDTINIPIKNQQCFVVSFIGTIRYAEILDNVAKVVIDNPRLIFVLHGEGPDFLLLKEKYANYDRIIFTGRYDYSDVKSLYLQSDIVWAAYPYRDFNVKYAISNKFHESIQYGVPCIYSNGTKLGDYVNEKALGYTVNPYDLNEISSLLFNISQSNDIVQIKRNLQHARIKEKLWGEEIKPFLTEIEDMMYSS